MDNSDEFDELYYKVLTEESFINYPKYNNNIELFISSHPEGASDRLIARCLKIEESEVEIIYNSAIMKIKSKF